MILSRVICEWFRVLLSASQLVHSPLPVCGDAAVGLAAPGEAVCGSRFASSSWLLLKGTAYVPPPMASLPASSYEILVHLKLPPGSHPAPFYFAHRR